MPKRWRTITAFLTLAFFNAPFGAVAQQRLYRVGVLVQGGPSFESAVVGLKDGLREFGLQEGKEVVFHVRDVKGDLRSAEAAARSLEDEKVDLIVSVATSTTLAAKRGTKSVPIAFYAGTDPVVVGLVDSFRKPGGRLTGVHGRTTDLTAKRLELLKDMVPNLRRVVVFYNPENRTGAQSVAIARNAARQLNIELLEQSVATTDELRAGLRALRPGQAEAHLHVTDAMMTAQADFIIQTAMSKKLPTMFQDREATVKGALASYGLSYYKIGRLLAKNVQRVLLGADPGDLPIEQLDRVEFVINLKTASAIGLKIPQHVLARADELIE
jgi:putative ABC transport system substrate-binding protein